MIVINTPAGEIELPETEAKFVDYKGYRGDSLLKKAGVKIEWTPQLLEEYAKCEADPIYFIETYMRVIHVDFGLVPFKLRPYQRQLIYNLHNNRRTLTTMARQSGKSTAVIGYLLWYVLFNPYKVAMILANKGDTAREILGKAQLAYIHLPKFLQQGIMDWNKGSFTLENGSRAIAEATSSASVRGYAVNFLILDEAAHIEHWDEFSTSTLPVISSGQTTKIAMISTPNGLNHFWAYWERAKLMNIPKDRWPENMHWNGYVPLLVKWTEVPGRDQKWYDEVLGEMNGNLQKFAQEYECDFQGSSGTLIAGWKIKELVPQMAIISRDGLIKYKEPIKGHIYTIIVDTSEGKGLDYSAFSVIDITEMPYQQVCTYRSNLITPGDYAAIIFQVAKAYFDPMILIEFTSLGPQVSDALFFTYEYENILMTENAGTRGKKISLGGSKVADRGLKISVASKATGCSMLKLLVEQNQLILNDFNTIEEISRFVKKKNTYQAEEGWHDDLVMGLVLFGWLSNQDYFKSMTEIDTIKLLRDKQNEEVEEDMLPFGFVDRGETDKTMPTTAKVYQILSNGYNPEDWRFGKTHPTSLPDMNYSPYRLGVSDDDDEKLANF